MKEFGIDISAWQGDYDLKKAKAQGAKFVILKCGGADDGLYKDSKFDRNYKLAKQLGLKVGAYFFSRGTTINAIRDEAMYCHNIISGKQFELPIYLDIENKKQLAIGKKTLTALALEWLAQMKKRGWYGGIYSSESYFSTYLDLASLVKYPLWIAKWSKAQPSNCGLWQFGGETNLIRSNKVAGQTTDQDYLLLDYTSTIKKEGLNGFKKTETKASTTKTATSTKKAATTCAITLPILKQGAKGGAVEGLQCLLRGYGYTNSDNKTPIAIDGDFGKNTTFAVKDFQGANDLSATGTVDAKTWAKLFAD